MDRSRRKTIKTLGTGIVAFPTIIGAGSIIQSCGGGNTSQQASAGPAIDAGELFFSISLAQWSLNRSQFGKSRDLGWEYFRDQLQSNPDNLLQGELKPLDFPLVAKNDYGIDAVEYVNTFFFDKAENMEFLSDLKSRCDGEGVKSLLIMCDAEGNLGDIDDDQRSKAVENHYKWVDAAKYLGCHSIRVNAAGSGTMDEIKQTAIDGLGRLSEYGAQNQINIIVENHGGYSSDANWLSEVISSVGNDYCGTLPDFGNFCIERGEEGCANEYDRYKGMEQLMPYAKGVSAKSHEFDENGNEVHSDFKRIMQIVKDAGYTGYVGIEYEGNTLSEKEGILATKALLEKVGRELS